jgi:hypothetical protein
MPTICSFVNLLLFERYVLTFIEQDIQTSGEHVHCMRPECPFVLAVGCCSVATCKWTHKGDSYACNSEQNFDEYAASFSGYSRATLVSPENELKAKQQTLVRLANLYISN